MSKYIIKYGESIYDVAIRLYGDASYAFSLITQNPVLGNLNNTDIIGIEINYEPLELTSFKLVVTKEVSIQKLVTISENQNLFDLSLQMFGTIERVFDVMKFTNIENINENEIKGISFKYDYENGKIQNYFKEKGIIITTKSNFTKTKLVWDGEFIIWDGFSKLSY